MNESLPENIPTVIFVGAFGGGPSAKVFGGQIAACRGILASLSAQQIRWIPVDSTMESIPPPALWWRAVGAIRRAAIVVWLLVSQRVDGLLLFASSGPSLFEKGVIAIVGRIFGVRVALAPRSGMLIDNLDHDPKWRRAMWRMLLRAPHDIVCQSEYWATFFASRLGRPKSELPVIRNGIRLLAITESAERKWPAQTCQLLYLGWLEPHKGPQVLAHAFLNLWRDQPGLRLWICGAGSMEIELQRMLLEPSAEGRVRFAGWVDGDEKRAMLSEAHCLVLPSLREGSPNALIEAMNHRTPVIGSSVGAVPEMLDHGKLGLLVPPGDVSALRAAIKEIARDPMAAKMRAWRGREFLSMHHDIEKTAEQWVGLFRRSSQAKVRGGR